MVLEYRISHLAVESLHLGPSREIHVQILKSTRVLPPLEEQDADGFLLWGNFGNFEHID